MSDSSPLPEHVVYTGEVRSLPLSFKDEDEAATDLTGASIYFTAKESFRDEDADAVLDEKVTSHTDAVNGLSAIPLDLSSYDLSTRTDRLIADVVLKDSAGAVTNYGQFRLVIRKSITDSTAD